MIAVWQADRTTSRQWPNQSLARISSSRRRPPSPAGSDASGRASSRHESSGVSASNQPWQAKWTWVACGRRPTKAGLGRRRLIERVTGASGKKRATCSSSARAKASGSGCGCGLPTPTRTAGCACAGGYGGTRRPEHAGARGMTDIELVEQAARLAVDGIWGGVERQQAEQAGRQQDDAHRVQLAQPGGDRGDKARANLRQAVGQGRFQPGRIDPAGRAK